MDTTTTTLAGELREAAARAREHLLPAVTARVLERHTAVVVICGNHDQPAEICRNCHYFDVQDRVLARLVAELLNAREPLAALLDDVAGEAERHAAHGMGNSQDEVADGPILDIARALNGGAA